MSNGDIRNHAAFIKSIAELLRAPLGSVNEPASIQPQDTNKIYRIVDCKYMYNLATSSLSGVGTYTVYATIGSSTYPVCIVRPEVGRTSCQQCGTGRCWACLWADSRRAPSASIRPAPLFFEGASTAGNAASDVSSILEKVSEPDVISTSTSSSSTVPTMLERALGRPA